MLKYSFFNLLELNITMSTRQIPARYYLQGTKLFVKDHLRDNPESFATVDQVLGHHANYMWYNIVLHNTWDFPFTKWTKDSKEKRLKHLVHFIGSSPIFSTDFGNFGWPNLELLNTKEPRKGKPVRPTYRLELILLYLYIMGDLRSKSLDDIRDILQEVSGKRISKAANKKLIKKHFLVTNNTISGVQSNSF